MTAHEANQLAQDLRKLAQIYEFADAEREAVNNAAKLLIKQAATIALVRHALGT